MLRDIHRVVRKEKWFNFIREAVRHKPLGFPNLVLKTMIARARWGFEPGRTVMSGLYLRPASAGKDYLKYHGELEPGLQLINWQNGGDRLVEDKVLSAERFVRSGIATAPIIAVIGRNEALHPHGGLFPLVQTRSEIVDVLAASPDEIFLKPADGRRGSGAVTPVRSGRGWRVGEDFLTPDELASRLLGEATPQGLLLQPRLKTHAALALVGGELGLSTVRINTALLKTGPEVIFAFLKLMGSKGAVDNFAGGKFGNMLAAVDLATGTLPKVYGRGAGQTLLIGEVEVHPVTGANVKGFKLPIWDEVVAFAKRAAATCAESPLLGADVAITDDGPMILEINADWDANVPQLTTGRGLRPILREIWPDLAADDEVKAQAAAIMRL